jgi:glycosyltransferase involved in cell wall biosynthesis
MKVSIILLAFKDRGYLRDAVLSIEAQTHKDYEIVWATDKVRVGKNLNRALERCTGDYVCYLCDDDMLPARSLEYRVKSMQSGVDMVHGCAEIIQLDGSVKPFVPRLRHPTLDDMISRNVINGGTVMYRRDVFERFGVFDEKLKTAEEYDYNMRIMSQGATVGYCDEVVYIYRKHCEQKSVIDMQNQKLWRLKEHEIIRDRYR